MPGQALKMNTLVAVIACSLQTVAAQSQTMGKG
jgi:hypothetical protein